MVLPALRLVSGQASASIQGVLRRIWIPTYAGMTEGEFSGQLSAGRQLTDRIQRRNFILNNLVGSRVDMAMILAPQNQTEHSALENARAPPCSLPHRRESSGELCASNHSTGAFFRCTDLSDWRNPG